jgi:putative nucleotidyltransferase with HDIG domain
MALAAKQLIEDVGQLLSLPELVIKINDLVNREDTNATDIAAAISQDPALSTRILMVANSPAYASSRQIDSITRAVTMLGTKQIRDLILSASAAKVFKGIPNNVISVEDFWHHSVYCALLARTLAELSRRVNAETMFTAGLLHDIGHLVMFNRIPEQAAAAILMTIQGDADRDVFDAEREILGFTHCDVGASLAERWHLPEVLATCIAYHHHPSQAPRFADAVAHVHIANAIASLPYSDTPTLEDLQRVDSNAWGLAGLAPDDIGPAVQKAQTQFVETQNALFGESN